MSKTIISNLFIIEIRLKIKDFWEVVNPETLGGNL